MDWLVSALVGYTGLPIEPARFIVSLFLAWFGSLIYFLKKNERIILLEHFNLTKEKARRRLVFEFLVIFLGVVFCVVMISPSTPQSSLMTGLLSEATVDHYLTKGVDLMSKKIEASINGELKR